MSKAGTDEAQAGTTGLEMGAEENLTPQPIYQSYVLPSLLVDVIPNPHDVEQDPFIPLFKITTPPSATKQEGVSSQ